MNRATYYNYIEERLVTLCSCVELRGKINILDYHLHSENFYRDLLNKLCTWNLENLNSKIHNVEAITLLIKAIVLSFKYLLQIQNRRLIML